MDDIYRDEVMEHYKNPRNFGSLEGADVVVEESNASCGDEVRVSLKLGNNQSPSIKHQVIKDIKFQGQGCAVSMAFTSLLIERVKEEGWGVEELKDKSEEDLVKLVGGDGVSPARQKCLRMGIKALRKAVAKISSNF